MFLDDFDDVFYFFASSDCLSAAYTNSGILDKIKSRLTRPAREATEAR